MAKGSNYHRWPLETPQLHLHDLGRWKRVSVDGPHDYRIEAELAAGPVVHGRYAFLEMTLSRPLLNDLQVKCDEKHPRCGQCSRLNRECDWDHRWNFSDATTSTQNKYRNITTTGNTVWDPRMRESPISSPVSSQPDNLPAFASLTNDEDRERKAGAQLPGTYGVVVTPQSFFDLPEYASASAAASRRRESGQCRTRESPMKSADSSLNCSPIELDPNFVLLDRFEDASSTAYQGAGPSPSEQRQMFPPVLSQLSISSPPRSRGTLSSAPAASLAQSGGADERSIVHFRRYIARRLLPYVANIPDPDSPARPIESGMVESLLQSGFTPLRHAICAISALNLSYSGQQSLEDALQHYHLALSTADTPATPDDLISDGNLFRHFLLLVYDVCVPMGADDTDDAFSMWAQHLTQLRQIAVQRHQRLHHEPLGYIIWITCAIDIDAGLFGNGNCDFYWALMQRNILPAMLPGLDVGSPQEQQTLRALVRLQQGLLHHLAVLARTANACRREALEHQTARTPAVYARWQASVSQVQSELHAFWQQNWPSFLGFESPDAGQNLPARERFVFESALIGYQAAVIYSRTSIFPGQRMMPTANQADMHADTERRCAAIIALASSHLETGITERRHCSFMVFLAGVVSASPDLKIQAMNIMTALQRDGGIGQNTYRVRQLLSAVYDEQRAVTSKGGGIEQVDWLAVARDKGLNVVNCWF